MGKFNERKNAFGHYVYCSRGTPAVRLPAGVKMKPSGRSRFPLLLVQSRRFNLLRTEMRRREYGGISPGPEVKKRRSCSPLRKRRRSPTPGGLGKEHNGHEVLKGILKGEYSEQPGRSHRKISEGKKMLEVEAKTETVSSSRRSQTSGRRWGQHESARRAPAEVLRGNSGWRRRSPSPYLGSRRDRLERGSPQR